MPSLYIITGSNGAGKSAVGPDYLPEHIRNHYPVFDGDLLFVKKQRELFPDVTRSPKEAKKLAFQHVLDTFEQLSEAHLNKTTRLYMRGILPMMPHGIRHGGLKQPDTISIYYFSG